MSKKLLHPLWCLSVAAVLLLSACSPGMAPSDSDTDSSALTWTTWRGYDNFLSLLHETCPDIALEFTSYAGANRTGYSWARMRADDISDIFITSQIFDEELASERLIDLSSYDFISSFSTSALDQVSIDGGIYLLPVNYTMYGILYNKTLMDEKGWAVPSNFSELEALCREIESAGLIPGVMGTQLTGATFSTVFNLAKTDWFSTPRGISWEREFLSGDAAAAGTWKATMSYVQRYIDLGMFHTDPEDRHSEELLLEYLGGRKAVFFTGTLAPAYTTLPGSGDELGMMPYISEDGSKNIYMYSPSSYTGLSRRLLEPGNEKKLENALQLLSLLFSPEGQAAFLTEQTPCVLGVRSAGAVAEDSILSDAQQAMWSGRAFPMTYAGWLDILPDIGQAYKEWFRGENDMDGPACIARMDELQRNRLDHPDRLYFCESTEDFTLEETASLIAKALGSTVDAHAAMVPVGEYHEGGVSLKAGVTGKLYKGKIDLDTANTICPGLDGEYAILTMTGAQAKELARAGFDAGDGTPFPYVLEVRGGGELEDGGTYQIAFLMQSYTEEAGAAYSAQVETGSIRAILRDWLEAQKTVSPGGTVWR
jgi:raffinose/stachyose/melibiose transport system substrate-binding protein